MTIRIRGHGSVAANPVDPTPAEGGQGLTPSVASPAGVKGAAWSPQLGAMYPDRWHPVAHIVVKDPMPGLVIQPPA